MNSEGLVRLAERCEGATGPSYELDLAIADACYSHRFGGVNYDPALWVERYGGHSGSLDAAMTLVPEGYDPLIDYTGVDTHGGKKVVELYYGPEDREIIRAAAATGPLALCAAALRALAAIKEGDA